MRDLFFFFFSCFALLSFGSGTCTSTFTKEQGVVREERQREREKEACWVQYSEEQDCKFLQIFFTHRLTHTHTQADTSASIVDCCDVSSEPVFRGLVSGKERKNADTHSSSSFPPATLYYHQQALSLSPRTFTPDFKEQKVHSLSLSSPVLVLMLVLLLQQQSMRDNETTHA